MLYNVSAVDTSSIRQQQKTGGNCVYISSLLHEWLQLNFLSDLLYVLWYYRLSWMKCWYLMPECPRVMYLIKFQPLLFRQTLTMH